MRFSRDIIEKHMRKLGDKAVVEALTTLLGEHEALRHVAEEVGYDPHRRVIDPDEPPGVAEVEEIMSDWASGGAAASAAPFLIEMDAVNLAHGLSMGLAVCYLTVVDGVVKEGVTPVGNLRRVVKAWRPIGPQGPLAYRYAPRIAADLPPDTDETDEADA